MRGNTETHPLLPVNTSAPEFAVCSIIAANYLTRALVMHDSLKRHHPKAEFWLLLIDDIPLGAHSRAAVERRGIHILHVSEIGLPPSEIANFRMIYDLTEVSTAYKPWVLETVARLTGGDVIYLDADIQFFAPMTSLVEAMRRHDLVLTPHVLQPMKRDGLTPSETDIRASGMYNLGFLGMNRRTVGFTAWWMERLKRECCNDTEKHLFTDQRWMDFAPSLFDCHIAKDETFNVAYWNADQRPILWKNGSFLIRGRPLAFFHFSGLDENAPHLLTRHHSVRPRVLLSEHPALCALVDGYVAALRKAEEECPDAKSPYSFNEYPGGGIISPGCRRIFLQELLRAERDGHAPPSPFGAAGEGAFLEWMKESLVPGKPPVTRLVQLLRATRGDLCAKFPDPLGCDAVKLVEWFRKEGAREFSLPPRMIPEPLVLEKKPRTKRLVAGLEIIGYLQSESGVGQISRMLARALENTTVPFETLVNSLTPHRQESSFQPSGKPALSEREAYDCCLLCVNADAVALTRSMLDKDYFRRRRVAGLWFWETEKFPETQHAAFEGVDEVWVASDFIRRALAPVATVPVHLIPMPLGIPQPATALDRHALGIPEGFFFLFNFDFLSIFRRKNPLGLVKAFKLAFLEGEGPCLVIKCINGEARIEQLEQLRMAARDRKDIIVLSGYLDAEVNQALTAACDCYVSLHRSEGLGLTIAEAMIREKPVIATAYSGNMEFMNESNSFLCRFDMVPVGEHAFPYAPDTLWAEPDIGHATELMRYVHMHPGEAAEKGRIAAVDLADRFSLERCGAALEKRWRALRSANKRKTWSKRWVESLQALSSPQTAIK